MEITGLSSSSSYIVIKQLNEELQKKGYMTIRAKVISTYFYERFFGKEVQNNEKESFCYRQKKGTWFVVLRYTDFTGTLRQTTKRGFRTKSDGKDYERRFLLQKSHDLTMNFEDFYYLYMSSMETRLRENTMCMKKAVIETRILPYFKNKRMCDITPADIIEWQNTLLRSETKEHERYSQNYLKTIHNQLSAMFNYAVRFYGLKSNPARIAGNIGKEKKLEMNFWTMDEYKQFSRAVMKKDGVFQAFEMLYWCGLRLGELLALTPADFDFKKKTVRISKSYQRIHCEDVITDPKTEKGKRTVQMPDFLCEEMKDYISRLYALRPNDRIFTITKSGLHHEMDRGCKEAGVKRIRIHDLRHSHVSMLIDMGFSAVDIAERVGHESVKITYRYAHMFPNRDTDIANKLNSLRGGVFK